MTDSEYGTPTETTNDELWREAFIDAGAETLADIRQDWHREKEIIRAENRQLQVDLEALLAPLKERLAKLEGQMTVLLGGDSANSAVKSKRLRQSQDNSHSRLLEHRPQQ
jgi:hypothetical protein